MFVSEQTVCQGLPHVTVFRGAKSALQHRVQRANGVALLKYVSKQIGSIVGPCKKQTAIYLHRAVHDKQMHSKAG